jgi:hypothetical protein
MVRDALGFVVVEWNQASHRPDLETAGMHNTIAEAQDEAARMRAATEATGRRERFTVAAVVEIEGEAP